MSTPPAAIRAADSACEQSSRSSNSSNDSRNSPAGRAAIVPPVGIPDHPKPPAIVQPEQFRDQVRGGVFLKVRRQVADRNAVFALGRRGPFPQASAQLFSRPTFRAQQLLSRCRVEAQKHERIHRRRPRLDNLDQFRRQIVQLAPIAELFQLVRQLGDGRGESRIDRQCRTERGHRLVRPAQPAQCAAQVPERLGVAPGAG